MKIRSPDGSSGWEYWAATDRVLLAVGVGPDTPVTGADVAQAMSQALDALPISEQAPSVPSMPSLADWLQQVRAQRSWLAAPTLGPKWRLFSASLAWDAGDERPCAGAFSDVLSAKEEREPWFGAAHLCAVASADRVVADWAARRAHVLDPAVAAAHATLLLKDGRAKDALALLDRTDGADAHERRFLADARVWALFDTGELAAAARLAATDAPSPEVRWQAQDLLRRSGRAADARKIRELLCAGGEAPAGCAPSRPGSEP